MHERVIDGYSEFEMIGEGGFSVVYRAREAYVERIVAIKVLRGLESDTRRHDRFQREIRAMGRLSGIPNIVDIYRPAFTERGEPCIVMPFLAGGSLSSVIDRNGPLPPNRVRDIGVSIATALATAHEHGIQHRDIKPENVLLDETGAAHLADFGIAVMDDVRAGTGSAALMSPPHAPPERFIAANDSVLDEAAGDVYSLGSTLYTALSGRPPFGRADDVGIGQFLDAVRSSPPPPLGDHVPVEMRQLVTQCLEKDPLQRPTARSLARSLAALPNAPETPHHTSVRPVSPAPTVHPGPGPTPAPPPLPPRAAEGAAPLMDVPTGATIARPQATTAPESPASVQEQPSTRPRQLALAVGAVAIVIVLAIALLAFTRTPDRDDTPASSDQQTQEPDGTTAVVEARDLVPPTLEPLQEVPGGFSFRWNDPNDPPAQVSTYTVYVDDEPSLPQMLESDKEQIVTEVERVPGQAEPVDLASSTYCVIVSVSEGGTSSEENEDEIPVADSVSDSDAQCTA